MTRTTDQPTPLHHSPHPLAFVATEGTATTPTDDVSYRCEVMGLGGFQKEGLVENLATGRSWRLACDEGAYLGGADMAPAPLAHWATGVHGDIAARIARTARHEHIALDGLSVTVTQGFGAQGSFARGEALALVFDQNVHVLVDTAADEEVIGSLVARALQTSPAYIAMVTPQEGQFALYTNGRRTPVIGVPASTAPPETDPFLRHAKPPAPTEHATDTTNLITRQTVAGGQTVLLSDDLDHTVQWHTHVTGHYDFTTDLVTSVNSFPTNEDSTRTWTLISDATNRRAPDALAYFSIGTAFCYHTQLGRYVKVRRMAVEHPRLTQISRFTSSEPTADVAPFDTHLFIKGTTDEAQTASLLTAAANTCYVHRGLAVPVETTVSVETPRRANLPSRPATRGY